MINQKYPFELPALPYPYDALEPVLDAQTLHFHHDKHFQTYVDNLNKALEPFVQLQKLTLKELLTCRKNVSEAALTAIMNNAGGVYNHNFYFNHLAPVKADGHRPEGKVMQMIEQCFGSFEAFKEAFSKKALAVFGSGWTYLVINRRGNLEIINLKNQQTPLCCGAKPIMTIDVWEHAYYLQYKNARADYIKNYWSIVTFACL